MAVKNKAQIELENKTLKSELEDMKKMLESLMNKDKTQLTEERQEVKEVNNKTKNKFLGKLGSIVTIEPNTLIYVESLFTGGMTLKGSHNKTVRFETFGQVMPITYEDLTYICSNHRSLAEDGYFFIHNEDAIKSLYLTEHYKRIISAQEINEVINLDENEMVDIYNSVTKNIKASIISCFIKGIQDNVRDYQDRNKISVIGKLCNKDLYEVAKELTIYRRDES